MFKRSSTGGKKASQMKTVWKIGGCAVSLTSHKNNPTTWLVEKSKRWGPWWRVAEAYWIIDKEQALRKVETLKRECEGPYPS